MGDQNEVIHKLLAGRWGRKRSEKVGDVVELYEEYGDPSRSAERPGKVRRAADLRDEGVQPKRALKTGDLRKQVAAPKQVQVQRKVGERGVEVSAGWPGCCGAKGAADSNSAISLVRGGRSLVQVQVQTRVQKKWIWCESTTCKCNRSDGDGDGDGTQVDRFELLVQKDLVLTVLYCTSIRVYGGVGGRNEWAVNIRRIEEEVRARRTRRGRRSLGYSLPSLLSVSYVLGEPFLCYLRRC